MDEVPEGGFKTEPADYDADNEDEEFEEAIDFREFAGDHEAENEAQDALALENGADEIDWDAEPDIKVEPMDSD